jgi:hypothetical protein
MVYDMPAYLTLPALLYSRPLVYSRPTCLLYAYAEYMPAYTKSSDY